MDDAKALKKMNAESHGEGGQKIDDKSHRMKCLQMRLKHLVLEFSTKLGRSLSIGKADGSCHGLEEV